MFHGEAGKASPHKARCRSQTVFFATALFGDERTLRVGYIYIYIVDYDVRQSAQGRYKWRNCLFLSSHKDIQKRARFV